MKIHPLVRGLIFTVVVPGSTLGWIPWLIRQSWPTGLPIDLGALSWLGNIPIVAGTAVYLWCAWDFAIAGRGTPAAFDPPVRLVARGLYKCVRNPMYIGILTILAGQVLLLDSLAILTYAVAAGIVFHLFILLHEEPHLTRAFGEEYQDYTNTVNRWLPNCGNPNTKKTAQDEPF